MDMSRWTLGRWTLEASRQQQQDAAGRLDSGPPPSIAHANSPSSPAVAAPAKRTPTATKEAKSKKKKKKKKRKRRRKSDDREDSIFSLLVPADGTGTGSNVFANLSDRYIYQKIWHNKTREGSGRRPDPRMDSAVLACLEDALLTPVDALCNAGFVFPDAQRDLLSRGSKHFVDSNGVSLRQRRDQLNRRLRQARKWIEDARAGTLTDTGNTKKNRCNNKNDQDSTRVGNEDGGGDNDSLMAESQEMPPLPGEHQAEGVTAARQSAESTDTPDPAAAEATPTESKRVASEDDTVAANLVAKALLQINQGKGRQAKAKEAQ